MLFKYMFSSVGCGTVFVIRVVSFQRVANNRVARGTHDSGTGSTRAAIPKQPKTKNSVVGVRRTNTFGHGDGSSKVASGDARSKTPASSGGAGGEQRR